MVLSVGAWVLYSIQVCWKPRNACTHSPACLCRRSVGVLSEPWFARSQGHSYMRFGACRRGADAGPGHSVPVPPEARRGCGAHPAATGAARARGRAAAARRARCRAAARCGARPLPCCWWWDSAASSTLSPCSRAARERSMRAAQPGGSQAQHLLGDLACGGAPVGRQHCSRSGRAAAAPRPPAPRAAHSVLRGGAASAGWRAGGAMTGGLRARRSGGSWRRCCRAAACGRRTRRCCTPRSSTRRRMPCAPCRARPGARWPAAARCPAAAPGCCSAPGVVHGGPKIHGAWPAEGTARALCTGAIESRARQQVQAAGPSAPWAAPRTAPP